MDWSVVIVVLVIGWLASLDIFASESCLKLPEGCQCSHLKHRDRIMCRNSTWTSFEFLNFSGIAENVTFLSLTETEVTKLSSNFSQHLPAHISKLNLSHNKINKIEDGAFIKLSRLEKLNLSSNFLSTLSPKAFTGLDALKKLDLQGNLLICDCHLSWILEWIRKKNLKISPQSACHFPGQLKGLSLVKILKKEMHCDWPLQLPVFEMLPSSSQLVFEGDSILFQCNVSNIDEGTQVTWMFDGHQLPSSTFQESSSRSQMTVKTDHLGLVVSSLWINQLGANHSGDWLCHVSTSRGNLSRSVNLVVTTKMTPFCPEIITWGNKGKYHWTQTLGGIVTDQPCAAPPPYGLGYQPARAYHTCTEKGEWGGLDVSSCPYVSEVTLVLEQFAKANLTQSPTILDAARGLRNYTGNGSMLNDVMDIIFITRTLEKYLNFVPQQKELREILVDVISIVMNVPPDLLNEAQLQGDACTRLLRILDSLLEVLSDSTTNKHSDNLILEEFLIKSEGFPGMRCSSFEESLNDKMLKRNLHCLSVNSSVLLKVEKGVEASIYVPPSAFQSAPSWQGQQSASSSPPWGHTHKLQFALYHSSVLFPSNPASDSLAVTSPVISCLAAHIPSGNLSQPIEVTLQIPVYTTDAQPVYWDRNAYGGKGNWNSTGCQLLSVFGNRVQFSCPFFGTFGVLQHLETMRKELRYHEAQFRLLHPAVYVGSFFMLACLLTSIGLYVKQWKHLQMNKNSKHSLVNTWLSLSLLILIFTLGVSQTDFAHLCQVVGLLQHYLTLCSLTWMVITINNLYKSLSRRDPAEYAGSDEDEEPRDPSVPPKPILRFYLVGWGVASIVCGISASVQIEHYAGQQFCFLSQSSSLAALYGPVAILLLLVLIYLLLIRCYLTPGTEVSGQPLVDQNRKPQSADTHSIIDAEFSFPSLLKYHSAYLVLFLCTWLAGAVAISKPFSPLLPFDDLIFSLIYCLFSALLGSFVIFFFCYSRLDVKKCLQEVPNTIEELELEVNIASASAEDGAAREIELDPEPEEPHKVVLNQVKEVTDKPCDVNLLENHNPVPELVTAGSMELFYNPRQSIVARKFFEKNRRQQQLKMLHKNNLEKEAAINGSGMIGRARAYSDTEHATSAASGERSFLCTSQSYGGPSSHQAELKALVHCSNQPKCSMPVSTAAPTQIYNFAVGKDNCGLPPWMVGIPCARSSCSECSNCTKPPLSLCSYSDITSVSQRGTRRRPHSRNYAKYQKAHQYSWDDKYGDSATKVFAQEGHATTGHSHRKSRRRVGSRNSVHLSPTPERVSSKKAFSRSQSANEQISKNRVLLNEGRERHSEEHLEPPT